MPFVLRFRRALPALALALSIFALAAAGNAKAGLLVSSATSCEFTSASQVFLPYADPANYVLAPGGAFERGVSGWTVNGATSVAGNEVYRIRSKADTQSLGIPAGGSTTSPPMCVGIEHPDLRFVAQSLGDDNSSSLRVDVLFEDAAGNVQTAPVGVVGGGASGWQITPQMVIVASLLPVLPGEHTAVSFRFTPRGTNDWRIDDVYVDPWTRG